MSTCMEFEDKIVEKAVEKAGKKLSIPKEKLQYDVISYGSSGIFGLVGAKKARIRVTVPKPAKNGKKQEKSIFESAEMSPTAAVTSLIRETFGPDEDEKTPDQAMEVGKDALQRIIDFITTEATISVDKNSEGRILYNVQGGDSGVLIGKRGQTLEAIQYLVEKVINKQQAQRVRILVDVEGYLVKRRNKLEGLASRLAEKAKKTKKPITIGQLNAHDRRVVHLTLKDDVAVRTQSLGDGFYRKLVIFPKKE